MVLGASCTFPFEMISEIVKSEIQVETDILQTRISNIEEIKFVKNKDNVDLIFASRAIAGHIQYYKCPITRIKNIRIIDIEK